MHAANVRDASKQLAPMRRSLSSLHQSARNIEEVLSRGRTKPHRSIHAIGSKCVTWPLSDLGANEGALKWLNTSLSPRSTMVFL